MGLQIHSPLLQYHQNKFSGVDHQGCGLFCSYPLVKQHQVILSSTNGESPLAINPSMAKKKDRRLFPLINPAFEKLGCSGPATLFFGINQSINRTDASKRFSNSVIGCLNLLTLLASVPIIGGGLWMSKSSATCESSLQTPLLVLGFVVLLVSLAGFVGACFNVAWALWLYLLVMLLLIGTLLGLTAFGFAVTAGGGGVQVPGRPYHEYRLDYYTGWLRRRITERQYWKAAMACVVGSKTCAKIALWTPLDYLQRDLSPIQSGCCKPPTSCTYGAGGVVMAQDEDCYRWNNAANVLCYACDSCKAGVLEQVRRDWHKLSVLNVVVLIFLIAIYTIGCCAFRNARRAESEYPYEENRMSKIRPRWDYFWWRWLRDRREQLY